MALNYHEKISGAFNFAVKSTVLLSLAIGSPLAAAEDKPQIQEKSQTQDKPQAENKLKIGVTMNQGLLPKAKKIHADNPETCVITDAKSFKKGLLLTLLLPLGFLVPEKSSTKRKQNEDCIARRLVVIALDNPGMDKRIEAILVAGELPDDQRKILDRELEVRGTSYEALKATLPQELETKMIDGCLVIKYQLPPEDPALNPRTIVINDFSACVDAPIALASAPAP